RMANTLILGIQDHGQYVGSYRDAQARTHGFLSEDGHFVRIDVPGALATVVSGLATTNGTTALVGSFVDNTLELHSFLCELPVRRACFTPFDVTLNGVRQTTTQAGDLNQQLIVGSFRDAAGHAHGFVCRLPVSARCFLQLDVQNGTDTHLLGIN